MVGLPAVSLSTIFKPPASAKELWVGELTSPLVRPKLAPKAVTVNDPLALIDDTLMGRNPNRSGLVPKISEPQLSHSEPANKPPPLFTKVLMSSDRRIRASNSARVNMPPKAEATAMAV